MKIKTKFFGEIEIEDSNVIEFNSGIPGFESYKRFVILDIEGKEDLKCLQSVDEISVCLLVMIPWRYFKDYELELSDEEVKELEIQSHEDVAVYNVITVREDRVTANLIAPVVINVIKRKGKQIIFSGTKYSLRQEIPCLY